MIGINVIESCPHTKEAKGVMHLSHKVLGIMAGAVWDKNEWLAFLVGTRSPDGLQVMVTDLRIPLQTRGHGSCETVKEEVLPIDVVGVVHSHHSMSAFFSQTDNTKLNPRFPTSIVVAQNRYSGSSESSLLGFSYKAEGKAPLPCGSIGIIEFTVQPYPMVKGWPIVVQAGIGKPTSGSLFTCPHTTKVLEELNETTTSKCGLVCTEPIRGYFGRDSKEFIEAVEKNTTAIVNDFTGYTYVDKRHGKGKQHAFQEGPWDEDSFLRHWSAYGGD